MDNPHERLQTISDFHGHLGPFVVMGYRMGLVANRLLGTNPFKKSVTVFTDDEPPRSCIADGIQLSSGCTLGKRNISLIASDQVASIFKSIDDGRKIRVAVKDEILERISSTNREKLEELAVEIFSMDDRELFKEIEEL